MKNDNVVIYLFVCLTFSYRVIQVKVGLLKAFGCK